MSMVLSFPDCPNKCNKQGQIFDRNLGKFLNCKYCEDKRKELADEGIAVVDIKGNTESIHEVLGFTDKYLSTYYDFDALINEQERELLLETSFAPVSEAIDELRGILSKGELPEKSYCFGLARKGSVTHLAFPLLALAYEKGLGTGKFLPSRIYYNNYRKGSDLQVYYDVDLLFVMVNSGAVYDELMSIKGLMEARAVVGKATIFVTNSSIDDCLLLLGNILDPSMYLASPYFIERKKTAGEHSYYSDNLRGGTPLVSLGSAPKPTGLGLSLSDLEDLR